MKRIKKPSDLEGFIEKNLIEAESIRNRNSTAKSLADLSDVDREWISNLVRVMEGRRCELRLLTARRIMKIVAWFDSLHWGED